jgi:chitinase
LRDSAIAALDASRLTHVNYAFANVSPEGTMVLGNPCRDVGACDSSRAGLPDTLGGNFARLAALKARYPALRVLVSVGGWTWSGRFSDVALTDSSRRAFAASGVDLFLRRWPGLFDGFDVDWEYPTGGGIASNAARPEDRANFVLLLAELRRRLDEEGARTGRRLYLTVATSAHAPRGRGVAFDSVAPLVDWINVMTYDFHGGSPIAHFNAPLRSPPGDPTPSFNVDSSVAMYLAAGVPRDKIVVGVPFYGRLFGGVAPAHDGLLQPAPGPAPADVAAGGMDYRAILAKRLEERGWRRHWEKTAQVPWLYDPATGGWITYDDRQSLLAKADYVRANALGGIMIWELGGDDGTLLPAIHDRLFAGR